MKNLCIVSILFILTSLTHLNISFVSANNEFDPTGGQFGNTGSGTVPNSEIDSTKVFGKDGPNIPFDPTGGQFGNTGSGVVPNLGNSSSTGSSTSSTATTTAGTVSYESYTNFPGVGRISSLCQLITALWYLGFAVLLTSVLGMFLWGGYIYVTAGVNAGKVNQAKEIFTNTITGLIIGLSIFIIINIINPGLLQGNCSIPSVGSGATFGGGGGTTPLSGNCKETNQSIWKCQRGGCNDSYFGLSSVDKQLYPVITEIFKTCSSKGNFQISSAYRPWSSGSFHQTGKAVDFADGANDNFTLLPTGKCIMDVAKQCGIPASRVNPGTDASQTFHVHIDLGR